MNHLAFFDPHVKRRKARAVVAVAVIDKEAPVAADDMPVPNAATLARFGSRSGFADIAIRGFVSSSGAVGVSALAVNRSAEVGVDAVAAAATFAAWRLHDTAAFCWNFTWGFASAIRKPL